MTDEPTCFTAVLRTARKQHYCCECPAPIMPGETYEQINGVWDHRGQTFRTCMPCAEFREQFMDDLCTAYHWDVRTNLGDLQYEWSEFHGKQ